MDRLEAVIGELKSFVAEREWEQFHDPKNLAMAVASEAGELLAEYRWVPNGESDSYSKGEAARKRIAAEVADVGIGQDVAQDVVYAPKGVQVPADGIAFQA